MSGILLPWHHKVLWPNGRTKKPAFRAAETRKHREWAKNATLAVRPLLSSDAGVLIPVTITVFPKGKGPAPDRDNAQAACKAYLDGIADALGINDRTFDPRTEISTERRGEIVVTVGMHREARPIGEIIKPIMAGLAKRVSE